MKPNFSSSFSSANSRCHVEDLLQSRQPLLLSSSSDDQDGPTFCSCCFQKKLPMFKATHNPDLMIVNLLFLCVTCLVQTSHQQATRSFDCKTSSLELSSTAFLHCCSFSHTQKKKKALLRESSCVCVCVCSFFLFFL
jgi:hypothetical protein